MIPRKAWDDHEYDDSHDNFSTSDDTASNSLSVMDEDTSVLGLSDIHRNSSGRSGRMTNSTIFPDDSISMRDENATHDVQAKRAPRTDYRPSETRSSTPSHDSDHRGSVMDEGTPPTRPLFGRGFLSGSDMYMLPADNEEYSRQDIQHVALYMHMEGLFACKEKVNYALRPDQTPRPAILDIGTGSGRWALDMGIEFPYAEVAGIDLAPTSYKGHPMCPPNVRYEKDDANLSMSHYKQAFNVVHCRSVDPGINDFDSFLYEVAQALRPNGVLLLVSGNPQIYDENLQPFPVTVPGEPGFTYLQSNLHIAYDAYHKRGNFSVDCSLFWHEWLEHNPNYREVETLDTFIPIGDWQENITERQSFIGKLMREDVIHIMNSFKPLMLADQQAPEDVDHWVEGAVRELKDPNFKAFIRWRYTTAIRTEQPWQERLESPRPLNPSSARLIVAPTPARSQTGSSSSKSTNRSR